MGRPETWPSCRSAKEQMRRLGNAPGISEPSIVSGVAGRTCRGARSGMRPPGKREGRLSCMRKEKVWAHREKDIFDHALRHRQSMQKPACWRRLRHSDSAIAASSCRTLVEASCPLERARRPVSFSSLFLHIIRGFLPPPPEKLQKAKGRGPPGGSQVLSLPRGQELQDPDPD